MAGERDIIGRAKTVLVFGHGDSATAAVSAVVARIRRKAGRGRLAFKGPADFDPPARKHLCETVLAAIDRITQHLGLKRRTFEVALVNLGAASAADVGLSISGFSADAAVMLAMLSAALRVPLRQDVVTTGHVASPDGDLRPVKSIPAKLAAASKEPSIRRFIYPSIDVDTSLESLAPTERERASEAIAEAKHRLRMVGIEDVADLLQAVCRDEAVVLGSLRSFFFETDRAADRRGNPVQRAAAFLTEDNQGRFWRALEAHLLAGDSDDAQELLLARARYQIRRKRYPTNFGLELLQLVRSLPPAVRRLKACFPLLPKDQCLQLCRLANQEDYEDIQHLFAAAQGKAVAAREVAGVDVERPGSEAEHASLAVAAVVDEISAEALASKIGLPIDSARAKYAIGDVTTESHEVFHDTISAFYLALLRYAESVPASVDSREVTAEAFALLERAFRNKGGADAAWAEARYGTRGGMRFVLDALTEQLKTEQQAKHIDRVLKEALDPLDWNERVEFMRAFLVRISTQLPPDIREQPPERFARHYEVIIQAYVQSLDHVRQLLRNF